MYVNIKIIERVVSMEVSYAYNWQLLNYASHSCRHSLDSWRLILSDVPCKFNYAQHRFPACFGVGMKLITCHAAGSLTLFRFHFAEASVCAKKIYLVNEAGWQSLFTKIRSTVF